MNRKLLIPALIVVAAIAAYAGWTWWRGTQSADVGLGGSGTIESVQVAVTPQTSGRILTAPEQEGAEVEEGQVLFVLDAATARLQERQADAGVRAAQANYDDVRDDGSAAEKAAARAQLDQAKAARDMARLLVSYSSVRSPIDGVLTSLVSRRGENAVPGSTLAVVSDPASLTVTIYVPEPSIGRVSIGQLGTITTDSSGRGYAGRVTFIASQAEFTPASIETKDQRVKLVYQVKLTITDPDDALKAGMPADVVLR